MTRGTGTTLRMLLPRRRWHFVFFLLIISCYILIPFPANYANAAASAIDNSDNVPINAPGKLILDMSYAGDSIYAVGERGLILSSIDHGQSWNAIDSGTKILLTSIYFFDPQIGYITGHEGLILSTKDAGLHWQTRHHDPEADTPLFDIYFTNRQNGFAVGAFGSLLQSQDQGQTWTGKTISNDERHLYFIDQLSNKALISGGESGGLLLSAPPYTQWNQTSRPDQRSLFGLYLTGQRIYVFGLHGKLGYSDSPFQAWHWQDSASTLGFFSAMTMTKDRLLIAGGNRLLLLDTGTDNPQDHVQDLHTPLPGAISAMLKLKNGKLLVAGSFGIRALSISNVLPEVEAPPKQGVE